MLVEAATSRVAERAHTNRDAGDAQPSEAPAVGSIPAFYINRERDPLRRDLIEQQLRSAGLPAERICAVEGLAVPADLKHFFFDGDTLASRLKAGEVGCYASHLVTMKVILERDLDYALILEDDALLPVDLCDIISRVMDKLPQNWDLVHICKDTTRAVKPVANLDCGRRLVRYSRVPDTTTGYLINRAGAAKFLRPLKRFWPIDTDFRQPWLFGLEIYGVAPRILSASETFGSSIHSLGNHSRLRRGFPVPSRHCWTGNPLHTPESVVFNLRTLGPSTWALCATHNALRRIVSALRLRPVLRRLRLEGLGSRLAGNLAVG